MEARPEIGKRMQRDEPDRIGLRGGSAYGLDGAPLGFWYECALCPAVDGANIRLERWDGSPCSTSKEAPSETETWDANAEKWRTTTVRTHWRYLCPSCFAAYALKQHAKKRDAQLPPELRKREKAYAPKTLGASVRLPYGVRDD